MHILIRRLKVKPGQLDEVVRRVHTGYLPIVRAEPGFAEFGLARVTEDEGITITVFDTKQHLDEANARAFDFAKQALAPLATGPVELVTGGEVAFLETASSRASGRTRALAASVAALAFHANELAKAGDGDGARLLHDALGALVSSSGHS